MSDKVLNSPRFYLEDVGTDGHPESVTWQNSTLYFVDKSRGVIVEAGEKGMSFISSSNMDKFFKKLFNKYDSTCRVTTGYNPFSEEVIVSVMSSDQTNEVAPYSEIDSDLGRHRTFAYDLASKVWTTAYSFYSSEYSNIGNSLISFKNIVQGKGEQPSLIWRHDTGIKNNFYNEPYPSSFVSVAVSDANLTKDYKSVSIDGTDPWELEISTSRENTSVNTFKDYEGTFYSEMPRNETSSSKNSKKAVGIIKEIFRSPGDEGGHNYDIVFANDIDQYHITLSSELGRSSRCLFFSPNSGGDAIEFDELIEDVVTCSPLSIVNKNTLRVRFVSVLTDEQADALETFVARQNVLIVDSLSRFYGDSLRDKFLEIQATAFPNAALNRELYSINIDYVESKLNSSR